MRFGYKRSQSENSNHLKILFHGICYGKGIQHKVFFCIKSPKPTVKKHYSQALKNTKGKCICTNSIFTSLYLLCCFTSVSAFTHARSAPHFFTLFSHLCLRTTSSPCKTSSLTPPGEVIHIHCPSLLIPLPLCLPGILLLSQAASPFISPVLRESIYFN